MKMGIFSIRDSVTEVFTAPWTSHNNASAIRNFQQAAMDPNTNIAKHPTDFSLYRIGSWDDDTGQVHFEEHVILSHGTDFNQQTSTET